MLDHCSCLLMHMHQLLINDLKLLSVWCWRSWQTCLTCVVLAFLWLRPCDVYVLKACDMSQLDHIYVHTGVIFCQNHAIDSIWLLLFFVLWEIYFSSCSAAVILSGLHLGWLNRVIWVIWPTRLIRGTFFFLILILASICGVFKAWLMDVCTWPVSRVLVFGLFLVQAGLYGTL